MKKIWMASHSSLQYGDWLQCSGYCRQTSDQGDVLQVQVLAGYEKTFLDECFERKN